MEVAIEQRRYTVSEYLHYERETPERHEYRDGQIIAMAGGTYNHSLITANLIRATGNALVGKPCRATESNLRIRISRTPLFTYPDLSVICGPPQLDSSDPSGETVTNPRLLAEVLSPSTEAYDRGEKFTRYRQIESLAEYVLVSQQGAQVETFFRQADGTWVFNSVTGLESSVPLRSLGIELKLAEIYAGVEFPPPPAEKLQERPRPEQR